jgi:hypothetical protein
MKDGRCLLCTLMRHSASRYSITCRRGQARQHVEAEPDQGSIKKRVRCDIDNSAVRSTVALCLDAKPGLRLKACRFLSRVYQSSSLGWSCENSIAPPNGAQHRGETLTIVPLRA